MIEKFLTTLGGYIFITVIWSSPLFKVCSVFALAIILGMPSIACSADVVEDFDGGSVSSAYSQLIQAELQLLESNLAFESKKSADFESLFADGHASWLENRQQKLVVDILKAKLACYRQFESKAIAELNGQNIVLNSLGDSSVKSRQATMQEMQQELTTLQQKNQKMAKALATLPTNDAWGQNVRLQHTMDVDQANVVAAGISLIQRLNASQNGIPEMSEVASKPDQASTFSAAFKRPSKNSKAQRLLVTQAELQVKLSQHHLINETQRLTSLQEMVGQGLTSEQPSLIEAQDNVNAINELLKEQQENLSWLRDSVDDPQATELHQVSVVANGGNSNVNESADALTSSPVLSSVLNQFELWQANYLEREATLKGEMYSEIRSRLEQVVATQMSQPRINGASADFSNVLISGQQRELEHYRWMIEKTDLQRELADTEVALRKESGDWQQANSNMLVSVGLNSGSLATLPSRFLSSDPFGLQTTSSAFALRSSVYQARRPALAARSNSSSSFRHITNRDALSLYVGLRAAQLRNFSRFSSFNRPSGVFTGRSGFRGNSFRGGSHLNSFQRSSRYSAGSGFGRYGY